MFDKEYYKKLGFRKRTHGAQEDEGGENGWKAGEGRYGLAQPVGKLDITRTSPKLKAATPAATESPQEPQPQAATQAAPPEAPQAEWTGEGRTGLFRPVWEPDFSGIKPQRRAATESPQEPEAQEKPQVYDYRQPIYDAQRRQAKAEAQAVDLQELAKRIKSRRTWAAIGDGLRALSNMVFTTQGAPSMHDPSTDLSPQLKARYDKALADASTAIARGDQIAQTIAKMEQARNEAMLKDYYNQKGLENAQAANKLRQDEFGWKRSKDDRDYAYAVEQDKIANAQKDRALDIAATRASKIGTGTKKSSGGAAKGTNGKSYPVVDDEWVTLGKDVNTDEGWQWVFNALPDEVRATAGTPTYDRFSGQVNGYKKPTPKQVRQTVIDNLPKSPAAQERMRSWSKQGSGKKKKAANPHTIVFT